MGDVVRVFLYALVAAASPVVLLATLAVLTSGRGRLNGTVYLTGFLLGQSAVCAIGLFVSSAAVSNLEGHRGTVVYALELLLGVALVAAGALGRTRAETRESGGSSSTTTDAVLARLEHLNPAAALSAGLAFGIGTKRLVITLLAATTISTAGLAPGEETALAAVYVAVASLPVWPAVAVYLLLGERADGWITGAKRWLTVHSQQLTYALSLAVGLFFCADALVRLV